MSGTEYPKINGLYKRGEKGKIVDGEFSRPEFEYLADLDWQWTEKVDGTNIRLGYDFASLRLSIAGRTDRAQIPPDLLTVLQELQDSMPWDKAFPEIDEVVTLYGEGYGARIQKGGGNYRPDPGFVLFDVKVGEFWLSRENVEDVAGKMGLDVVPVVLLAPIREAEEAVKKDYVRSVWPGVDRPEGLVGRPSVPLFTNRGDRITTKIKWKDYA